MSRNKRWISIVAVALASAIALVSCGSADGAAAPALSITAPATAPPSPTTVIDSADDDGGGQGADTDGGTTTVDGQDEQPDPETAEWRDRLLDVVGQYREARAECLADPSACETSFDRLVGPLVTGQADASLREAVAERAAEGIRTRGIDTDLDFYRSFELYQREPTEAALTLCVVDRSVVYKPATDTAPERVIDDDEGSYFVQFRVVGDTPDELVIESVVNGEVTDLEGEFGQCEQYAT